MTGDCKISSSLQEEIYWSRFRVVQFLLRVSTGSNDGVVLPKNFVKNLKEKLTGRVVLRTPSGSQWAMDLATDVDGDGILLLKGTWKHFAEAHNLQKDDTLIFKYYGNSEFDVTMFDGKTGCEKICSYFVRNEVNLNRTYMNVNSIRTRCDVEKDTNEKNKSGDDDRGIVSSHDKDTVKSSGSIDRKRKSKNLSEENKKVQRGWISGGSTRKQLSDKMFKGDRSNQRVATALEKKRTIERDKGILVVMRASYVHRPRCQLVFSVKWARSQGLKSTQEVELRMDGKSWLVTFFYREASGMMTKGWRMFVADNGLELDDVCLFDVVSGSKSPVIINVRIFRVADDTSKSQAKT